MVWNGTKCIRIVRMVKDGLGWLSMVKDGLGWFRMVQDGLG